MTKAYASYFVSYLLNSLKKDEEADIKSIILFGSVARGDAGNESDVDIFVDTYKKSKKFNNRINEILEEFYNSREAALFKSKKIDNKINVLTGILEDWASLKKSIESTGIVLYGSYVSSKVGGKKYILIFWDNIKKNRGAFLNKVYGFSAGGKEYPGLIKIYGGKKIGKSCIMVPIEYQEKILILLRHYGVNAKISEIYA